ncbi:CorA family divalent cation transporter [Bdellovibrio sp. HCB337]|uniref:CorA family divalent cation transporter n=1 Tax=Bdellovibrio sp. HCB337 TaxID=3394358 RepID=UPI0039A766C8
MKRFEHQWQDFKWIDIEGPSQQDFLQLASEFDLPLRPLANCLDPEHLPHAEFFGTRAFFILRHYDKTCKEAAGTMQELTTKIVFVVGPDYIMTIHRAPIDSLSDVIDRCNFENFSLAGFTKNLISRLIASFDIPLEALENKTEVIEGRVFALRRRNILREGYKIKRKASTFRKVFKFTNDVLLKLQSRPEFVLNDVSDLKEPLDRLLFYTENSYEEITGLLSLHLSLMSQKTNEASYKTNEIMRILTVVSIFFLPLNFIAGVYGMNFDNMPELKTEHGYYITLGVMAVIAIAIMIWIYKKEWVKKEDL